MKQTSRRSKTGAPAASGRKYPTLARMVAMKPRSEPEEVAVAEEADVAARVARNTRRIPRRAEAVEEAPDLAFANGGEHIPELLETQPVPASSAVARIPDRRLAQADGQARTRAEMDAPGVSEHAPRLASGVRPLPLPDPDLVVPAAAVHAGLAAAAALAGAGLLLTGTGYAFWPFSLAAIAGSGGWLGYAVSGRSRRLAASLLLLAQLGTLAWLLALVGARAALLALVPALALLALRWLGRAAAYAVALFALALYALAAMLQLNGALVSPVALSSGGYALLDGAFVASGLLCLLLLASQLNSSQMRAEMAARARQHEVRTLRARLTHMRQQVEDDAARLDDALARALAGKGMAHPVETDGLLNPLAETANVAAERLAALHRDREDRLRLEGAVRTVTRAVERAWLGLPWSWPAWSGTALDELVALLRAPRPQETRANWSDETPTLTAIPTVEHGMTPQPWERPTPISAPLSAVGAAWSPELDGNGHVSGPHPASLAAGAKSPSALLPWQEWDTWREWSAAREE